MVQTRISFYRIDECGYFARESELPEFGNCYDLLAEFSKWAKDGSKTLAETCTYHPQEGSHLLRTFCYDCVQDAQSGDYLLVTWNETPSFEGKVAHVPENERVGEATVSNVDLPPGAVPGFPTYFLFMPELGVYASIRFASPLNGNAGLQKLMKEFLAKFASFAVHDEEAAANGEIRILGYRKEPDLAPSAFYPRFSSSPLRQPALIEFIRGSRELITKIHRKNLLVGGNVGHSEGDVGIFAKLFAAFGTKPHEDRNDIRVSYEMHVTPTEQELDGIISQWHQTIVRDRSAWEDVGFHIKGEQHVRWLSSELVKFEPLLSVIPDANEIVNVQALLRELRRLRPSLVQTIGERDGRRC